MTINYELLIGLIGIALAIYFGLRGIPSSLRKIEEYTKPIERTAEIVTRLDERIEAVLRLLPLGKTVELTLKNVGEIKVSAEPSLEYTDYHIQAKKPIFRSGFLVKKSKETDLGEKEKELFGSEVNVTFITSTQGILRVPSTDPKTCVKFITIFLKWLDSTYWESLKELEEYEKITL